MSPSGKALFAALVLLAFPFLCAHADDLDFPFGDRDTSYPVGNAPGFHAVERAGITAGGDIITKVTHPDGTFHEISAGGLYQIGLGALYRYAVIPLSVELTLNYHYNSDYNGNDNASFRRVPLEALVYFNGLGRFRIGGGMRYVYSARANSILNGVTEKVTFENTRGSIIEIGYEVRPYGWVNLRHVKERYRVATYSTTGSTPSPSGNAPYDGSHFGLFISYEY